MNILVELDSDAALVLFELPASRDDLAEQLNLEAPERNSLWDLQGALEKRLAAPFAGDYLAQLSAASASLIERFGA